MRKVLGQKFFNRDTVTVAKSLLGKFLVRKVSKSIVVPRRYSGRFRGSGHEIALMITEVEVYDGFTDKASHAARGKTARNSIMFGPAGHWYVYFTYGMHWMLNIVTRERDYPAAVLIRAASALDSFGEPKGVIGGPAKLTKFLKINKKFNGLAASEKSGLWVEDGGMIVKRIKKGSRVGVSYAGQYWAKRKWRFWI
ncbi:MAG: DNA-3-methyladenine glycosylase [bacterium]|nr:DNA-3-methyladenine glycosylase [bacterium]